jgi:hypothetical protein
MRRDVGLGLVERRCGVRPRLVGYRDGEVVRLVGLGADFLLMEGG